jgi:Ulp1 family protease
MSNYGKVKNWTKKVDIFKMEYLVIPVNSNNHWNVIIVCQPAALLENEDKKGKEDAGN